MDIDVLWDRLAGGLQEYVENYCLYKSQSKIMPSYDVDYKIDCLDVLQKHTTVDDYWVHQISGCDNINDLPVYLQELVLQYLPRFFEKYPIYRDAECLQKKMAELMLNDFFNEQMTSNEARSAFFGAIEGKTKEEIEQIKLEYSKVLPKIIERELELAKDGRL